MSLSEPHQIDSKLFYVYVTGNYGNNDKGISENRDFSSIHRVNTAWSTLQPRYPATATTAIPPSFTGLHVVKWGRLAMFAFTDDALSLRL